MTRNFRPIQVCGDLAFVPLQNGMMATIDASNVHLVDRLTWTLDFDSNGKLGYVSRRQKVATGRYKKIYLHRLILGIQDDPAALGDHRDRDTLNNKATNLRVADRTKNSLNRCRGSHNKSGFKGVDFVKHRGRWRASIFLNGYKWTAAIFDNAEDAAKAYDAKALELFGEFAHLNFPMGAP